MRGGGPLARRFTSPGLAIVLDVLIGLFRCLRQNSRRHTARPHSRLLAWLISPFTPSPSSLWWALAAPTTPASRCPRCNIAGVMQPNCNAGFCSIE